MPILNFDLTEMGFARVKGFIGSPTKSVIKEVCFLADTGAFYTTIPPALAMELGIKLIAKIQLTLADKRSVLADTSLAYIKILDRETVLQIAIFDVPEPLLGVTTLEGLGLRVNLSTGEVEYSRPYGVTLFSLAYWKRVLS